MANRAKRTNMYNHAHQVKVNKWKKKILWYKGKIDICQSKIDKYTEMIHNETNPESIRILTDGGISYYENRKKQLMRERGDLIRSIPHRKVVKNKKAV